MPSSLLNFWLCPNCETHHPQSMHSCEVCGEDIPMEYLLINNGEDYPFVDLGLSVMWAKYNLGAMKESGHGDYFTWNEIHDNSLFSVCSTETCIIDIYNYYKNQKVLLNSRFSDIRMPSLQDFAELIRNCRWEKAIVDGINGYKVIGRNGNHIFLPISGEKENGGVTSINCYGQYLSSSYKNDNVDHYLLLRFRENEHYIYNYNDSLRTARTIRPVIDRDCYKPIYIGKAPESIAKSGFVDLGLSVKWATCNLGATRPEGYGDYFAWGNNEIKTSFYDSDCSTHNMNNSELLNNGIVNIDGYLTPQNDIATISLGKGWRIPTVNEFNELIKKCKWTLISNSIYKVEGPNGNHILLPLNDYIKGIERSGDTGCYWTSSIGDNEKESFGFYMYEGPHCSSGTDRSDGQAIRPVRD